jgi:hypothetical protein
MVRKRGCRAVLVFVGAFVLVASLGLVGGFTLRPARADYLDKTTLANQKTTIAAALQKVAGDLKYQYKEGQTVDFNVIYPQEYGAVATLGVTSGWTNGETVNMLVIQFPSSELAAGFATATPTGWPMSDEVTPIGNHQAAISAQFFEHDSMALAEIAWVCGVQKNLVLVGSCNLTITEASQLSSARSKLITLATTVHDALVAAEVCQVDYRLDVHPVMTKDGSNYEFPLRLSVQLQKRQRDGTWKNAELLAPLYVEYTPAQGTGFSLIGCLHPSYASAGGVGATMDGFALASQSPLEHRKDFVRFDADEEGKTLFTKGQGQRDILLLRFAWKGSIKKDRYDAPTTDYLPDYAVLAERLYALGQAWNKFGRFTGDGGTMTVTVYADPDWQQRNKGHEYDAAVHDGAKDAKDFTVQASATINLNEIAEVVKVGTTQFVPQGETGQVKPQTASMRHSWISEAYNTWEPLKAGYPLMPWDRISLGIDDKIIIAWPDGTTYAFGANPKAMYDPQNWPQERLEFWVSPGQATDILDKANYHDSPVWQAVSLLQPSDPCIAVPLKAAKSTVESETVLALAKAVGGALGGFAGRVVLGVVGLVAEKQVAKPVVYQRIKSSVVMLMKDRPEEYLVDGELTTFDDAGNAVQTLAPGEMTRFGESWLATDMSAPVQGAPPAAAVAQVKELETMMGETAGTGDLGTGGTGTGDTASGGSGSGTSVSAPTQAGGGSAGTTSPNRAASSTGGPGSSLGWRFYLPIGVGAGLIVVAIIVAAALSASRRRKAAQLVSRAPALAQWPSRPAASVPVARPPGGPVNLSTGAGWFIAEGQKSLGPYSWAQLVGFARVGALGPHNLVWNPQQASWVRAADLPGLFGAAAPPPPPPPNPRR